MERSSYISRKDFDTSQKLARVHNHVERVIRVIKQKYTILQSTLPANFIICCNVEGTSELIKFSLFAVLYATAVDQLYVLPNCFFNKQYQCGKLCDVLR